MLSFIYRLRMDFERKYGEKPNMLYLNRFHFEHLRAACADPDDITALMQALGMTIMITEDAINPYLARIGEAIPLTRTQYPHTPRHDSCH
jgi:hypothetical protein